MGHGEHDHAVLQHHERQREWEVPQQEPPDGRSVGDSGPFRSGLGSILEDIEGSEDLFREGRAQPGLLPLVPLGGSHQLIIGLRDEAPAACAGVTVPRGRAQAAR